MPIFTSFQPIQNAGNQQRSSFPAQPIQGEARNSTTRFECSTQPARRCPRNGTTRLPLDGDPESPFVNIFRPRSGPYATPWLSSSAQTPWSMGLISQGRFDTIDATLMAFIVDCTMKLYIIANINLPCLESMADSDIIHTIVLAVYRTISRQLMRPEPMSHQAVCFGRFYLNAVADFKKIRERCDIIFRQHVQGPATKIAFATNSRLYNSFKEVSLGTIEPTFEWVYGQSPSTVVDEMDMDKMDVVSEEDSPRDPISIRNWVFEFN